MPMEQQTMTGSGLYILIAVQLLFSMLILLRIRQYRKKPTGCLPSILVILSTAGFTSVLERGGAGNSAKMGRIPKSNIGKKRITHAPSV